MQQCSRPSVIRVRIEGLKGVGLAELIGRVQAGVGPELRSGCAVSVSATAIRVRRLPLV